MIIGTAGHVDHGKTSLVRALTGVETDRLPEEKARGITIDLGFAYVQLDHGGVMGFVDVPGHERLVHTMIAGASSIGMALLVVAADDGVMPQTREHVQILASLGIARAVVALTKTDLVDADRVAELELEISLLLEGTPLAGAAIFPVSATTGAGVGPLRASLLAEAARDVSAHTADGRAFRLAVDRCFSLAGTGTVVTGSVVAGLVRVGENVLVQPPGLRARVRGIHVANRAVEQARAGERCALNLTGPGISKDAIGRGDWVLDPARATSTRRCDIALRLLESERAAMKQMTQVLLHHGAGQMAARVILLEPTTLRPGQAGFAHLVLDRPLPMRHGDRLVLRDISATRTIAGGQALDPRPPERLRRAPARIAVLKALSAPDTNAALRGWLAQPPFLIAHTALLDDWGLIETTRPPDIVTYGTHIATEAAVGQLTAETARELLKFHTAQPGQPGMTPEALRIAMTTRLPRDAFTALLAHLLASGAVAADGAILRAPTHRRGLAEEEARLWDALRPLLNEMPYRPPLLREAAATLGAPEVTLRRTCKAFARQGLILELAPDRFFLRDAVIAMAQAAHTLAAEIRDGFTAAQFRDLLGNGRQLAIQVLDDFDRRGITVRRSDLRRAGKDPAKIFGPGTLGQ